jgi:hypothetical protein
MACFPPLCTGIILTLFLLFLVFPLPSSTWFWFYPPSSTVLLVSLGVVFGFGSLVSDLLTSFLSFKSRSSATGSPASLVSASGLHLLHRRMDVGASLTRQRASILHRRVEHAYAPSSIFRFIHRWSQMKPVLPAVERLSLGGACFSRASQHGSQPTPTGSSDVVARCCCLFFFVFLGLCHVSIRNKRKKKGDGN